MPTRPYHFLKGSDTDGSVKGALQMNRRDVVYNLFFMPNPSIRTGDGIGIAIEPGIVSRRSQAK